MGYIEDREPNGNKANGGEAAEDTYSRTPPISAGRGLLAVLGLYGHIRCIGCGVEHTPGALPTGTGGGRG